MIFFRIALLLLTGAALLGAQAHAQPAWPARPIRIIVAYAPGGSSEVLARLLQPALSPSFGYPVVVENRPGAATVVGSEVVARSAPDGHTLLLADVAFALLPAITERMPYDTIADFAPVTQMGVASLLLVVRNGLPATDLTAFLNLALALAEPERLT